MTPRALRQFLVRALRRTAPFPSPIVTLQTAPTGSLAAGIISMAFGWVLAVTGCCSGTEVPESGIISGGARG